VTVKDQLGNPVSGATVSLGVSGTDNAITPPSGTTDVNGEMTATLSSTMAETKTITATVNDAVIIDQTVTVTVLDAGVLSELVFTVQPSNTQVDSIIKPAVQVTAVDQFGNTVKSYSKSVRITIGSNGSVLAPTPKLSGTSPVQAVSGVATFDDLSINQIGNGYTLVASQNGFRVTSAPFDITPLPPLP